MYILTAKEYIALQRMLPKWENVECSDVEYEKNVDFNIKEIPDSRLKKIALSSKQSYRKVSENVQIGDIVEYLDCYYKPSFVMIGGYVIDRVDSGIKVVSYANDIGMLFFNTRSGQEIESELRDGRWFTAKVLRIYKST